MAENLEFVPVERKRGDEPFHRNGRPIGANVREFWQWSASDFLGNTERGILAEYLVAFDLEVADTTRGGWAAFDLTTKEGITVEVKSAAYVQSWKQHQHLKIIFNIRPTYAWDPLTGKFASDQRRHADAYVFCILANRDQNTVDPLNLNQWEFYVMPTSVLNERVGNQKSIGLQALQRFGAVKTEFGQIGATLRTLFSDETE